MSCSEARALLQERMDGPVAADRAVGLASHLEACPACREYERDLADVRRALGELPELRLPDEALEQVWDRTIRARAAGPGYVWRGAVAAGLLAAALAGVWLGTRPAGDPVVEPTAADIARAEREIRLVFARTAGALRKAERAAVREVIADEVSPALRRVPIQWPGAGASPGDGT